MKRYKFSIRGQEYNVHIQEIEDNCAKIEVNGTLYEVTLDKDVKTSKTPKLVRQRVAYNPEDSQIKRTESSAGLKVKSPLPGTIFKLHTKVGQSVAEGESLLVLEAMKMENDIRAERAGVVKEIRVKEGDAVLEGDVLVVLE